MESMSTLLDTLPFEKFYEKYKRRASKSKSSEEEKSDDEYDDGENKEEDVDDLGSYKEEKNTQRCPRCGATVGRRFDRCIRLICWCQCEFCYTCGEYWNENHFKTCEESSSHEENKDENENDEDSDEGKNEEECDDELGLFKEEKNSQCCPGCGATVRRRFDRSIHLICWCQCEFCYTCGNRWNENHLETCEESSCDEEEE